MIDIKNYVVPKSIDEAYEVLASNRLAMLLGGGAFIRMGNKRTNYMIDLSKCNIEGIIETETDIEIGAMTTFGEMERSDVLKKHFNDLLACSVKEIVGVQLRNIVTVGGTVYSRYGFSDLITGLLALDTYVNLHKGGLIPLETFLIKGPESKDILKSVLIKKDNRKAAFKAMRNSKGDYAILNAAVSKVGNDIKIAVGARPGRATLAYETMAYLKENGISTESLPHALDLLTKEMNFGTNGRGSQAYREKICRVLVKNGLEEVGFHED
ncbi:molybdopterin dehydrogenase, FAD-binding [Alkaliphilus metalliredigens QYMF]|uniref:Molybdopterin dehydrogenase, FAD-binding n=1 Tax=Alkaliphilus metalliredigens (strain QYMF) TaxID=293826 RepID=A6TKW4_ALKMQ|nr:FAD binding domain-containing protein [Alkaliphilus metalliredigens]ABR46832.1 molybdopterin dehydrogenase, FAD-binding [Alkaliphilus metalliredigens QYMF]